MARNYLLRMRSGGLFFADNRNTLIKKIIPQDASTWDVVRRSAIRGILNYLLNNKSANERLEKLDGFTDLVNSVRLRLPYDGLSSFRVETIFSRREIGENAENTAVNLATKSWNDAHKFIKHLKEPLCQFTGKTTLAEVNLFFLAAKEDQKRRYKAVLKRAEAAEANKEPLKPILQELKDVVTVDHSYKEKFNKLYSDNAIELREALAKYERKLALNITAIEEERFDEIKDFEAFYTRVMYDFFNWLPDITCLNTLEAAQVSNFSSPGNQKSWLDKKAITLVRGGPELHLKVDFDMHFSTSNAHIQDLLARGPGLAYWGEGGFGILETDTDELPGMDSSILLTKEQLEEVIYGKVRTKIISK